MGSPGDCRYPGAAPGPIFATPEERPAFRLGTDMHRLFHTRRALPGDQALNPKAAVAPGATWECSETLSSIFNASWSSATERLSQGQAVPLEAAFVLQTGQMSSGR